MRSCRSCMQRGKRRSAAPQAVGRISRNGAKGTRLGALYDRPAFFTSVGDGVASSAIHLVKIVMPPAGPVETLRTMTVAELFSIEGQMALAAAHRALARLQQLESRVSTNHKTPGIRRNLPRQPSVRQDFFRANLHDALRGIDGQASIIGLGCDVAIQRIWKSPGFRPQGYFYPVSHG